LYARDDDLWRTDVYGTGEEQLSVGRALNWRQWVTDWPTDWLQAARYRPPRVSPDGRWIALSDGTQIVLVDVSRRLQVPLCKTYAPTVDWAPTGDTLVFADGSAPGSGWARLVLAHAASRQLEPLYEPPRDEGDIKRWAWSPDGRFVAFDCCLQEVEPYTGASVARVQRIEVATRRVEDVGTLWVGVASSDDLCWSADGRVLTDTVGAVRCAYPARPLPPLSPDGTQAAEIVWTDAEANDRSIRVVSWERGQAGRVLWTRNMPEVRVSRVYWSPDRDYLLVDDDEPHSPIWRLPADGTGDLEQVVADGFLIEIVAAWQ
jgi:dipeptidyl aminopeptidase/acylaminoacyl peptidase